MNSNFGNFDFDLGIGSNNRSSKPLNEQKNKSDGNNNPYSYSSTTTQSWQPGKPSWTHQPAPSQLGATRSELGGPASMVGDIKGKSWTATTPQHGGAAGIGVVGIVNKNPNLFGDLVNSALGQNKGSSNAPLKSVAPAKTGFSMGGMADSLPKTGLYGNGSGISYNSAKTGGGVWGSGGGNQSFSSAGNSGGGYGGSNSMNKGTGLGGAPLRGSGGGMGSNKDPFGSLMDFSKPMGNGGGSGIGMGSAGKAPASSTGDFDFGDFQNAPKTNTNAFPSVNTNPLGSNAGPKMGSFGAQKQAPPPVQSTGADSFDMFFPPSAASGGGIAGLDGGAGGQQFSGGVDWGFDSGVGGHDDGGTTELDGLPPPPAGVSASTAKTKGMDNYKQGQYADAIKWLSWAEILLQKAGDSDGTMEVLASRASCYKEVGEYKKAVADCSKVLDHDEKNVAVLVQRALLYESMEKYRLGADDLRTVMKLDPGNRVARSTIHRLNKMAD